MSDLQDNVRVLRTEQPPPGRALEPRRLGRFSISIPLLDLDGPGIRELMRRVVIIDARANLSTGVVDYVALCGAFDLVPAHLDPPWYDCVLKADATGDITAIEWQRRERIPT